MFNIYHDKFKLRVNTMAEINGKQAFDKPKVSGVLLLLLLILILCIGYSICIHLFSVSN